MPPYLAFIVRIKPVVTDWTGRNTNRKASTIPENLIIIIAGSLSDFCYSLLKYITCFHFFEYIIWKSWRTDEV